MEDNEDVPGASSTVTGVQGIPSWLTWIYLGRLAEREPQGAQKAINDISPRNQRRARTDTLRVSSFPGPSGSSQTHHPLWPIHPVGSLQPPLQPVSVGAGPGPTLKVPARHGRSRCSTRSSAQGSPYFHTPRLHAS